MVRSELDQKMIDDLERSVKELAREREFILKTGVMTEEEVTEFITEKGAEYAQKYKSMGILEMLMDLTIEAIQIGGEERFIEWMRDRK